MMKKLRALALALSAAVAPQLAHAGGPPAIPMSYLGAALGVPKTDANNHILPANIPGPTVSTLGGVLSLPAAPHEFVNSLGNGGALGVAQPAFSDLSGQATLGQLPTIPTTQISGLAPSATTDTTNASNITSGTLPGARLPMPAASVLGGAFSLSATAHEWVNSLGTNGAFTVAQPSSADISDFSTAAIASAWGGTGAPPAPRVGNPITYGVQNTAAAAAIMANSTHPAQVVAGVPGTQIANYNGRDSVALYVDNTAPPYLFSASATSFDATHAYFSTPLTQTQINQALVGMFVVTTNSPPDTGMITAVDPAGGSITVNNWTVPGNTATGQVPPSAATVNFNPITGVWGVNFGAYLNANSVATSAQGAEVDMWNYQSITNGATAMADVPRVIGENITTTGTQAGSIGSTVRGDFRDGYWSQSGWEAGYLYDPTINGLTPGTLGGFVARMPYNLAFNAINSSTGTSEFSVGGANGNIITLGTITASGSVSANGGLTAASLTVPGANTFSYNLSGVSTGSTSGGAEFGWNFTNGDGDTDITFGQGGGGLGELNFYPRNASGTIGTQAARLTAGGNFTVPGSINAASGAISGVLTVPTATAGTSTTQAASTAFTTSAVGVETTRAEAAEALLAPLASPSFTGVTSAQSLSVTGGNIFSLSLAGVSTGKSTGGAEFGWNFTNGDGDTDITFGQGTGGLGELNFYPRNGSGAIGAQAARLTAGGNFTAAGSLSGTSLSLTGSQTASTVFAAPNGAAGAPSFRQLGFTDLSGSASLTQLPTIPASQTSGLLPLTGGTLSNALTLSGGSLTVSVGAITATMGAITEGTTSQVQLSGAQATITGAAASNRLLRFNTSSGDRWALLVNSTAESGSNAGSDLQLNAYDDSGNLLSTPLKITRSTGAITDAQAENMSLNPGAMLYLDAMSLTGAGTTWEQFSVVDPLDSATLSNGSNMINAVGTYGGSTFSGNRFALNTSQTISSALPTLGGVGPFIIGYNMSQTDAYPLGGTSTVAGGTFMGYDGVTNLAAGATNLFQVNGGAFDMAIQAGASTSQKIGVAIDLLAGDAVQGSALDTALTFETSPGSVVSPGWKNLISVGNLDGWWPVASTGTIIGTTTPYAGGPAYTAAYGIDFSAVAFSGDFLKSDGFTVDGSGNIIGNNVTVSGFEVDTNANSLASAGTTLATATALTKTINVVTACASGGVSLPPAAIGTTIKVFDRCGGPFNIYPDSSTDEIENGSAGAAVVAISASDNFFTKVSATQWLQ
jgi:hypothetical protein